MKRFVRVVMVFVLGVLVGCQTVSKPDVGASSVAPDLLLTAESAYAKAVENPSVKLFSVAVPHLENALEQAPSSVSLQYKLYDVYYRLLSAGEGRYFPKARDMFFRMPIAVRRELSPPSLAKMSGSYSRVKNDEQAFEALLFDMLEEQPNSAAAHSEFGRFVFRKKDAFTAIPFLKQGLRLNPDYDPLKLELGYAYSEYVRGLSCYYENPRAIREAIRWLQVGHKMEKPSLYLKQRLSYLYSLVGMNPLSLREALSAYSIKASDHSKYRLAGAYIDNGKFDDALTHYLPLIEAGETELNLDLTEGFAQKLKWQEASKYAQAYLQENRPRTFYSVITLEFVESMSGQSNGVDYHELISGLNLNPWQRALDLYWRGKSTEEQLLSLSADVCETAEAEYYIGLKYYDAGQHDEAKAFFQRVLNRRVYNFIEYGYAKALLKTMNKSS